MLSPGSRRSADLLQRIFLRQAVLCNKPSPGSCPGTPNQACQSAQQGGHGAGLARGPPSLTGSPCSPLSAVRPTGTPAGNLGRGSRHCGWRGPSPSSSAELVCLWADCRAPGAPAQEPHVWGSRQDLEFSLREKPLQGKGDCLCRGFPHQQSCSTSQLCKQTPRACPKSGFIKLPELSSLSEQRQKSSVKECLNRSLEAAA